MGHRLRSMFRGALRSAAAEAGQTLTEYALLVVFIALAVIGALQLLGANLLAMFDAAAGAL